MNSARRSPQLEKYDILMLVVIVGATLFGAVKGFAWQLASIGSIVVSYFVAYHFREPLSQSIQADPPWNRFLAMLILYVGTSLVIWVAFRMISQSIDRLRLKEFDRQVGAIFGLAKGALYCTLITLFAVTLLGDQAREAVVASKSGRYIAQVLDRSESIIPAEIQEVVGPYLEKFDQRLNGGESQLTPWLNQVTENALQAAPWNGSGATDQWQQPAQSTPWPNNPISTSNQRAASYSQPNLQTPAFPASSSSQLPPAPPQTAPWSSIYAPSGN
jgi:membrane protein required for colicin V production